MRPLIAVLAAGQSRRFAGNKLAEPLAGKPLGRWALEAARASGCDVVVITGTGGDPVASADCETVENPRAREGIGASIACAATLAAYRRYDSLLVMLADMPLVDTATLTRLLRAGAPSACRYPDGRPGVPALFAVAHFPRLQALTGDQGAAGVLATLPGLKLIDGEIDRLLDVDRRSDLARAAAWLGSAAAARGGGS